MNQFLCEMRNLLAFSSLVHFVQINVYLQSNKNARHFHLSFKYKKSDTKNAASSRDA